MKKTINIIMGLAIFLSLAGAAWAVDCGGGAAGTGPCSCGNTVVEDTILDEAVDPVVSTGLDDFCTGDGLKVNAGVTLDLGGNTIRGDHGDTGITINGDGATVTNGTIRGFNIGVSTNKTGGTISKIKALRNRNVGIQVLSAGTDNELVSNTAEENGIDGGTGNGISVDGDDNMLKSNKANKNAGTGIDVGSSASGNLLDKNTASENSEDGIKVAGPDNELTGNKASENRGDGINVTNDFNVLKKNTTNENFGSGIVLSSAADDGTLEGNKADKNSGDGVSVNGKRNSLKKITAKKNDGRGIFAKDQTDAADDNIDDGGNKGTDNGGVGAPGTAVDVDCEIAGGACL